MTLSSGLSAFVPGTRENVRQTAPHSIACSLVRGGTSRGVFLLERDLPPRGALLDRIIASIMGGSPVDGLGGESILTNKVAIVGAPTRPDADVDYTFIQVGRSPSTLSYEGTCGNVGAAVGPFALESGLVALRDGPMELRIHGVNIGKIIRAELDARLDARTASSEVVLDFAETEGSKTGVFLPFGAARTTLDYGGARPIDVSVVDLANPVVFVRARDLGLAGNEEPCEIESDSALLRTLESIRGAVAVRLGFAPMSADAARLSPYVPFICYVASPMDSALDTARSAALNRAHVTARLVGYGQTHRSFPGTAAAALAAAAFTPGTVVAELASERRGGVGVVTIGHPSGTLDVEVRRSARGTFDRLAIRRTWRKILDGRVYVAPEAWT